MRSILRDILEFTALVLIMIGGSALLALPTILYIRDYFAH